MADFKLGDAGVKSINTTLTNTNSVFIVNIEEMSSTEKVAVKEFVGKTVTVVSAVRNDTGAPVNVTVDGVELTLTTTSITDREITIMYTYI